MEEQRGLQECWRWLTSISATAKTRIGNAGAEFLAGVLGLCAALAHLELSSMGSALSGKGGFELRGVVKPLALFRRHLALLAPCHLFSRQAARKSDTLYTYSVVAFELALSL